MKPNVAGLLVLGISAVLFLSAEHRARVAALSALGLAIFSGWLAAERLYLPDVVRGYLSISARGFSLRQFLQDLSAREKVAALLLLAASLLPWLTRFRSSGGDARGRRLALVAALAGLYGFVTNGEHKLVDLPLLLLALWWLGECDALQAPPLAPANDRRLAWWRSYVAGLAACLVLSGVVVGALRHRVHAIGRGAFFEPTVSSRRLQSPFFSRLEASPRLVEVESELAGLLASASPSRPYFGPRMQWAYAAFRYPSPSGQPVWWHPGVTYPASRGVEALFIDWWIAADYDLVVFLNRDVTYLPPEFLAAIAERYEERPGYRSLSVFTRRRLR
jgi:hypothetical protein